MQKEVLKEKVAFRAENFNEISLKIMDCINDNKNSLNVCLLI